MREITLCCLGLGSLTSPLPEGTAPLKPHSQPMQGCLQYY